MQREGTVIRLYIKYGLTIKTSSTTKTPPPPFRPFAQTKHPGNSPKPLTPGAPPLTLTPGANLSPILFPAPCNLELSKKRDEAVAFAESV